MFVGHYAASLALKRVEPRASLGVLFLAVQFVDILFFPFVMLGIEKLTIIENYTASTHFRLDLMPYTHSLLATVVWTSIAYGMFLFLFGRSKKVALVIALAVASHWLLDLVVHTPDLPLSSDASHKLGFGLWNNAPLTFGLEAILLVAGLVLYLSATSAQTVTDKTKPGLIARYGMCFFVLLLVLVNAVNIFGPLTSTDVDAFAIQVLLAFFIFAGIAGWLDKHRHAKSQTNL